MFCRKPLEERDGGGRGTRVIFDVVASSLPVCFIAFTGLSFGCRPSSPYYPQTSYSRHTLAPSGKALAFVARHDYNHLTTAYDVYLATSRDQKNSWVPLTNWGIFGVPYVEWVDDKTLKVTVWEWKRGRLPSSPPHPYDWVTLIWYDERRKRPVRSY